MNDKELALEIKKDRKDNCLIDDACIARLKETAKQYGKEGVIVIDLLDLISRVLNL